VIVGIDIGTQSLKAVVTDDHLAVLGASARSYEYRTPQPGWAEQDPLLWEQALAPAIADALARAGVGPEAVDALGICGQLDGCVAVDAGSGEALGTCLIWCDRRAEPLLAAIDPEPFTAHPGIVPDASHPAPKAAWLLRHDASLDPARVVFHQAVTYLVRRLTGEDVTDPGLASITMLYDLERGDWDPALLGAFGLERRQFPRIVPAHATAGRLTATGAKLSGLPEGTPVATGTGDDFSTPLGAGVAGPGLLACCVGTAEVNGTVIDRPLIDRKGLLQTTAWPGGGWFLENPGWLAGGAVRWAMRAFGIGDEAEFDRLAAQAPPGSEGVLFLPALSGTTAPEWNANARGCFYGLADAHDRSHLARAVLEGCAYAMRDVRERMAEMEVELRAVRLVGGGANSRLWAQIRADVCRLPVEIPGHVDTSPLGAAALAAVAAGRVPDLATAAARLDTEVREIHPDPDNAAAYDQAWTRYRRLFDALRPMYTP